MNIRAGAAAIFHPIMPSVRLALPPLGWPRFVDSVGQAVPSAWGGGPCAQEFPVYSALNLTMSNVLRGLAENVSFTSPRGKEEEGQSSACKHPRRDLQGQQSLGTAGGATRDGLLRGERGTPRSLPWRPRVFKHSTFRRTLRELGCAEGAQYRREYDDNSIDRAFGAPHPAVVIAASGCPPARVAPLPLAVRL